MDKFILKDSKKVKYGIESGTCYNCGQIRKLLDIINVHVVE